MSGKARVNHRKQKPKEVYDAKQRFRRYLFARKRK